MPAGYVAQLLERNGGRWRSERRSGASIDQPAAYLTLETSRDKH
jgi:hypothetical protein